MRILIVEDEVIIAEDLADIVRSKGYMVECAYNYDEALLALKDFKPDLLFCDIDLGEGEEKDGIALVKALRTENNLVSVVFITALVTEAVVKKAQALKPFTYLVKPFNAKQVAVTASIINETLQEKTQFHASKIGLTEAEQKVLHFIAQGFTSKEISAHLFISEKTVRNHRYNILKKLNLSNENNSLTKWALSNKFLTS